MTRFTYSGFQPEFQHEPSPLIPFDELPDHLSEGDTVLVGLPCSKSPSELSEIIRACQQANVTFMPAFLLRFLPSIQVVHDSLSSGKLGKPGLLRIHQWSSTTRPPVKKRLALDEIDLALWMFGSRPQQVYAISDGFYLQIHLGFPEGGMALIDIATSLPLDSEYFSLSLIGSNGAAYNDDHHNMQLLYQQEKAPLALKTGEGTLHIRKLVDAFVSKSSTPNSDDALLALEVADAVSQSLKSHCALHWKGDHYEQV